MGRVLILRTCNPDMTSYGGFRWPSEIGASVEAPDWNPEPVCGGGLHGLREGIGGAGHLQIDDRARGVVFDADETEIVDIDGTKCKAKRGVVKFVGTLAEAAEFLNAALPSTRKGYRGTATAGDRGTATAGDRGTATAGEGGTATAGYRGTATAGDRGTATAGDRGTATAGYRGTATAGEGGTATAGEGGAIAIQYWNGKRYKSKVATVKDSDGDGDLEPNTKYRINDTGEFEAVEEQR